MGIAFLFDRLMDLPHVFEEVVDFYQPAKETLVSSADSHISLGLSFLLR